MIIYNKLQKKILISISNKKKKYGKNAKYLHIFFFCKNNFLRKEYKKIISGKYSKKYRRKKIIIEILLLYYIIIENSNYNICI